MDHLYISRDIITNIDIKHEQWYVEALSITHDLLLHGRQKKLNVLGLWINGDKRGSRAVKTSLEISVNNIAYISIYSLVLLRKLMYVDDLY